MLTYIKATNIALIEEVELNLDPKLNIFTGETGAGKSMLIDSIQFAIGNRSSKQIIRKGEDMASVTLCFEDQIGMGIEYLKQHEISVEANEIILERVIYQSGRTIYKVNGSVATRQMVKELSSLLIDVHGQHEPQSLLDIASHIRLLDSFGEKDFSQKKEAYRRCYERWQSVKADIQKIGDNDRKKLQLKDMLSFQINEIGSAKLKKDEEENLKEQYDILSHAEKIMMQCQKSYDFLDGETETSATLLLGQAIHALQDISDITTEIKTLYDQFLSIQAELQDATYQMRRFADQVEYSPELLLETQNRLDLIYRLKQKYGSSVEEILAYKAECEKELAELEAGEHNKENLEKELASLEKELKRLGAELSKERRTIASKIEVAIDNHLHDLQMPYAKFEVAINDLDTFNSYGQNDVEFLIRTNLGEDLHPLSKIASGGEISRVMLAIKTVLVLGDTINTVIFDEIDTGISGVAAQKVAEKLAVIAKARQVLCITHLPQIAAMGDIHFLIEKQVSEASTTTHLEELKETAIHEELCRLMGGIVTESTLKSAVEIKTRATLYKEHLA
ncbi:DNA repair protein RecN [Cellulosilyticum sp. ST5]|uniref:DNA repair protein RecN n=1 Tax=Cellulosilyticum lentocellum (strain ATCC 49066 / DSM 5427 / NCIMB 11756 / RHM5) TaxID=642492 RepID=F2JMG0_CELLD|nr:MULTISPECIES: DNA repair protein RecN [Cellulosilyticum]ADZ83478.1 DNA repair protein RecN [Cellulosilyticum lentocellum DSM 5427]QEH68927.1 DNA repair protein RecN [Cellulosilyticum sp. WCF-2]